MNGGYKAGPMRNAAPTSESSQVTEQSVRRNSAAATTEEEEEEKGQKKTHTQVSGSPWRVSQLSGK